MTTMTTTLSVHDIKPTTMRINIQLYWDTLNPNWDVFNKTNLAKVLECNPSDANIRFPLFQGADGKLTILDNGSDDVVGMIGFTTHGVREILGVRKLTRVIRTSRNTLISINNYILSLQ